MSQSLFLRKWLPLWVRKKLDNTNSAIAKFITARFGPLAITHVDEVVNDPKTRTIGFCPLCAEAIKVDRNTGIVGVFLYQKDMTPINPEVKIKPRHTLSVDFNGHLYQVGCSGIVCSTSNVGCGDFFGTLNGAGELQDFTTPFIARKSSVT